MPRSCTICTHPEHAAIEAGYRKVPSQLDKLNKAWDAASPDDRAAFLARIANEVPA